MPRDSTGRSPRPRSEPEREPEEIPVPVLASDEELLRTKRFDALEPDELARLYRLMTRLRIATPPRRTRRAERDRRGERIDMRRTLRGSLRTGGDPIRLARRRRRVVRRRLVLLCDISGSMEPYARAYLQFLTCAAGGAARRAEAFVFATRLTRLTRALASRNPERAIQRAAAAAPDWSSGTRIGDALKTFNDRHGRRGMARGAVVVILSDGWERGDPALVGREMERLRRLAHRIVWVNPRVSARGFAARAGGIVAALPLLRRARQRPQPRGARRGGRRDRRARGPSDLGRRARELVAPEPSPSEEPWPSATPVPGSSVAMPSGYGPSRGKHDAGMVAERDEHEPSPPKICIYPGCDRPAVPPHPLGGPQPSFCDLEEHNALTAHQERQRLRAADREQRTRQTGGSAMADEAYRAVFLRVHPTGKMVLSLTTESDGEEARYAQLVADELGVPALDVKVVPADTDRFGVGHGYNTARRAETPAAIESATGKILAKAQLLAGAGARDPARLR